MHINIFSPREGEPRSISYADLGIEASLNSFTECDCVLDIDTPFSQGSKVYPPQNRALLLRDPPAMLPNLPAARDLVCDYYGMAILSIHPCFMGAPQAALFPCSGISVPPLDEPSPKELGISALFDGSYFPDLGLHGLNLRRYILETEDYVSLPSQIYNQRQIWRGERLLLPENKEQCFRYMFHLAIESHSQSYYFSSELLDCFATFTLPIYHGDPMIGQIFDMRGIVVADESRLHDQINSLTEYDYESRIDAIRENHRRSQSFWDPLKRACQALKQLGR